jgi:hypothetical protein
MVKISMSNMIFLALVANMLAEQVWPDLVHMPEYQKFRGLET